MKHQAQQQYTALSNQICVFRAVANPKHNLVWNIILAQHSDSIQAAWKQYMEATCTCFDAATTFRLGASWVTHGDTADIANLADVEDYPEDYGHHMNASRD